MRYRVIIQNKDGKLLDKTEPSSPGDRRAFVYAVHVNHIRHFGDSEETAAVALIERSNSVPKECTTGIELVKIGTSEYGGRSIVIRCR